MIQLEEITSTPTFSNQLENKILYSNHASDISVSYQSTYTLKYVIDGIKNYSYNNQHIEVSKDQYLILNNDSNITTEAKKGTRGLSIFLSPELINEIYEYHTNNRSSIEFLEVIQKKSDTNIHQLLYKIAYLYENNPDAFKEHIDNFFITISELIVQNQAAIDANFLKLNIVKHSTKRALYTLITEAKDYIHDNLKNTISLSSMSHDIGISKYYLHRLFTEIHGNTPLAYLTNVRIQKAKNQLQYSKDSIFEIAIACGFDNTAYFSNVFKKHTGLSPTQFRKKI